MPSERCSGESATNVPPPLSAAAPPGAAAASSTSTRAPASAASTAAHRPAAPPPITMPPKPVIASRPRRGLLAPDVLGDRQHELELAPLVVLADEVAADARGEAALRAEREPLDRHEGGRLLDAALDLVGRLHVAGLRGEEAEHDDRVVADEPQRLEPAGAIRVVLEHEAVVVQPAEDGLGDRVVRALAVPLTLAVAATQVHAEDDVVREAGDELVVRVDRALAVDRRIVAAAAQDLQRRLVGVGGEPRLVDVDVRAPGVADLADHLALDLHDVG